MHKLHTMVESMVWNEENNSLAAVADGHLVVWFYPEVVYMDRDLLSQTLSRQSVDWGKTAEILDFRGTRVTVRRSDGALQVGEQRREGGAGERARRAAGSRTSRRTGSESRVRLRRTPAGLA